MAEPLQNSVHPCKSVPNFKKAFCKKACRILSKGRMGVNLINENEKLRDMKTGGANNITTHFPKHKEVEDLERRMTAIEQKVSAIEPRQLADCCF